MGYSGRKSKRGKSGWRIVIMILAIVSLVACGLSITLAVRKVAAEKKIEEKLAGEKTMSKTAPTFPPVADLEKDKTDR